MTTYYPHIAIIGGGVSGLVAGIYAQLNGFSSIILEQHSRIGGLCAFWKRQGFHIDNCVHWLLGSNTETELGQLWSDVHVILPDEPLIQSDFFLSVEDNGLVLHLWRNMDKLQEELLSVSPQDEKPIREFISLLTKFSKVIQPCRKPLDLFTWREKLKMLWQVRNILLAHFIYSRISLGDYAKRFKHPLIRKLLTSYFPYFYNAVSMLFVYGNYCAGNADIPYDGSKGIVERMLSLYYQLGGKVLCNKKVVAVNTDNKTVREIKCSDGSTYTSDLFIATCDLHQVMHQFFDSKHIDQYMVRHFQTHRHLFPIHSSVNIYFSCDTSNKILPGTVVIDTAGLSVFGNNINSAVVKDFNYAPMYSPVGQSLIQVIINQYEKDCERWIALREQLKDKYNEEKKRLAEKVKMILENKYNAFMGKLHLLDVVTPATNYRYCSVYKGAYMSFALTANSGKERHDGRVKGLDNFYLAGQWLHSPGGLPGAAVMGKFSIVRICHDLKLPFKNKRDS